MTTIPRDPPARSVWLALFGLAVLLGAAVLEMRAFLPPSAPDGWVRTPCVLRRFEIQDDPGRTEPFHAAVAYDYSIAGRLYTGTRLWPGKGEDYQTHYARLIRARRSIPAGPEGDAIPAEGLATTCWVNPASPGESCLLPGSPDVMTRMVLRCFLAGLMFYGLAAIIHGCRRLPDRSTIAPGQAFFFVFFAAMGTAFLCFFTDSGYQTFRSLRWRETPAEVIWTRIERHSGKNGPSYSAQCYYRYRIAEREYRGSGDLRPGGKYETTRSTVAAYPPGTGIAIFADPEDPAASLTQRAFGPEMLFGFVPLVFVVVGYGGIWNSLNGKLGRMSRRNARGSGQLHPVLRKVRGVRLRGGSRATLVALLAFSGPFALFAAIIGWAVFQEPEQVTVGVAVAALFGLTALGILAVAAHQAIGLLGPAWMFRVDRLPLAPGETTTLRWQRCGGRGAPQSMRIVLLGHVIERRHPPKVACRELLLEIPTAAETMQRGACALQLPALRHDPLAWQVMVEFRLARWLKFSVRADLPTAEEPPPRRRRRA